MLRQKIIEIGPSLLMLIEIKLVTFFPRDVVQTPTAATAAALPGYEIRQCGQAGAAAEGMSRAWQCPTQTRDYGCTTRSGSGCSLHSHSPSASRYAASAVPDIRPTLRTSALRPNNVQWQYKHLQVHSLL